MSGKERAFDSNFCHINNGYYFPIPQSLVAYSGLVKLLELFFFFIFWFKRIICILYLHTFWEMDSDLANVVFLHLVRVVFYSCGTISVWKTDYPMCAWCTCTYFPSNMICARTNGKCIKDIKKNEANITFRWWLIRQCDPV